MRAVPAVTSCLIGMTAGIGGGMLRDLRQVPIVLLREVYALAALCGAVVLAVGDRLRYPPGRACWWVRHWWWRCG